MAISPTRHYVFILGGYSICHHGNMAYHLPHITMAMTSATLLNNITYHLHCGYTINPIKYGNNICHGIHGNNTCHGNPYALMNIWLNICHIIQLNLLYVQKTHRTYQHPYTIQCWNNI